MPLVSILIPSYNHGEYLSECLESIRSQAFQDWEVILVDDGSTDDSVAIARSHAVNDPRIQVHANDKNLGTYGTEQKALELSRGELIAIMNSDDLWASSKLEKQVDGLKEHPEAPYCYTLGWMVDDEGKVDKSEDVHFDWPMDGVQQPLPYLLYENRILASSVLWRRQGLRFETSCRYSGDWVALLEQSQIGPALCLAERLCFWRQHERNTYTRSPKQILEEIRVRREILRRHRQWFLPGLDRNLVGLGLAKNGINLQYLAFLAGHRRLAFEAIWAAFKFHPRGAWLWKRVAGCILPMKFLKSYFLQKQDFGLKPSDVDAIPPVEIRARPQSHDLRA